MFLIIAIFGLYGYRQMPVRENPDVEFPIVSINVVLAGAEPEVIETEIIEPLEEQINTIEGLKELRSTAREEVAQIIAEFELWRDVDIAAQDVRDRIDRARRELPDGIESPIVRKLDPDAQPIMWIALTGDHRWDPVRMSTYADEFLKERLENLRGVGQIIVGGEKLFAVRIRLDPEKLAAHRITVQQVVDTIRANNIKIPSGRIESKEREFLVKTIGQFSSAEPFNDLIITKREGGPVRLGDVGRAVPGVENERQLARFVGQQAVGLGVVKQRDANTVALANVVRERMTGLANEFPPGLDYTIATDSSVYIEQNIADLVLTIFLATGLVMLVVVVFLRNLMGTLIACISIPTSLLGGLAVAYALDFSLNVLTLLGLILAIGIVIDDAVVVLENSYRHQEEGQGRVDAARSGTTEVAFANIANSLSLVSVFIPVAFTAGIIGYFLNEFGLTVAATVLASTLTGLTLTPMLCSRLLRVNKKPNWLFRQFEKMLHGLEAGYNWILQRAFRQRVITLVIGGATFLVGIYFFDQLSTEFVPPIDRSEFMINFETPEGSTVDYTHQYARRVNEIVTAMPEVKHQFYAVGLSRGAGPGKVNQGIMFIHLVARNQRQRKQAQVMQELRKRLEKVPGGQSYVVSASSLAQTGSTLKFVLQHHDLDKLARRQDSLIAWMRNQPEYIGVNSNLKMNKPQLEIHINRQKASEMGISVAGISNTMRYLLGEPDISEIERQAERYEVIPEVVSKGRMVPTDIGRLYVRNDDDDLVSLDNLVDMVETTGPSAIHHYNRLRAATLSASNPPDVALGDALAKLEGYFKTNVGGQFQYAVTGRARDFRESFFYLSITLVFAIVFVYLVLAAQFESFVHPFTILMTLPLACIGAFLALWALNMTLNIFSFIGFIMLVGMATKNAILLIDFANQMRARGKEILDSAKDAARIRFRPVIMTTISTVLGLMPIALGYGAGGEARAPLGVTVAAGLLATTGLTLVIIPVLYTLMEQGRQRLWYKLTGRKIYENASQPAAQ
jgi:hydrophobe/amphiphile efflux-1 (HAE1) family protein